MCLHPDLQRGLGMSDFWLVLQESLGRKLPQCRQGFKTMPSSQKTQHMSTPERLSIHKTKFDQVNLKN